MGDPPLAAGRSAAICIMVIGSPNCGTELHVAYAGAQLPPSEDPPSIRLFMPLSPFPPSACGPPGSFRPAGAQARMDITDAATRPRNMVFPLSQGSQMNGPRIIPAHSPLH